MAVRSRFVRNDGRWKLKPPERKKMGSLGPIDRGERLQLPEYRLELEHKHRRRDRSRSRSRTYASNLRLLVFQGSILTVVVWLHSREPEPAVDPPTVEETLELSRRIRAIYNQHVRPEKTSLEVDSLEVDAILARFSGREGELLGKMMLKYGVAVGEPEPEPEKEIEMEPELEMEMETEPEREPERVEEEVGRRGDAPEGAAADEDDADDGEDEPPPPPPPPAARDLPD